MATYLAQRNCSRHVPAKGNVLEISGRNEHALFEKRDRNVSGPSIGSATLCEQGNRLRITGCAISNKQMRARGTIEFIPARKFCVAGWQGDHKYREVRMMFDKAVASGSHKDAQNNSEHDENWSDRSVHVYNTYRKD